MIGVQRFQLSCSSDSQDTSKKGNSISEPGNEDSLSGGSEGPPSLPSTCCMSGCANCVWLDYAEEMVRYYDNIGQSMDYDKLLQTVDTNVEDPMVKAFLRMELNSKYVFKKKT